jgi:hypothetical protein
MSGRRRTLPPRDQEASAFSAILMRLCEATRANGVALVDQSGETVDYAGYRDPFTLRVMAAEWQIVLDAAHAISRPGFEDLTGLTVRATRATYAVVAMTEGYALVLELPRRGFELSPRAVTEAALAIEKEAELPTSLAKGTERWSRVEVQTVPGDRFRPAAVWLDGAWHPVTVLGRHQLANHPSAKGTEKGGAWPQTRPVQQGGAIRRSPTPPAGQFRVARLRTVGYHARVPNGLEFALVREPLGIWFASDL